jgi:hypothetical protein
MVGGMVWGKAKMIGGNVKIVGKREVEMTSEMEVVRENKSVEIVRKRAVAGEMM